VSAFSYLNYLTISIFITVVVGHTLHRDGRVFVLDCMEGNERMADAANDLLLVGYYLVNIAFVGLFLRFGNTASTPFEEFESIVTKVGVVCLTLGVLHFGNIFVLQWHRSKQQHRVNG